VQWPPCSQRLVLMIQTSGTDVTSSRGRARMCGEPRHIRIFTTLQLHLLLCLTTNCSFSCILQSLEALNGQRTSTLIGPLSSALIRLNYAKMSGSVTAKMLVSLVTNTEISFTYNTRSAPKKALGQGVSFCFGHSPKLQFNITIFERLLEGITT
jgi:hypothetical protein